MEEEARHARDRRGEQGEHSVGEQEVLDLLQVEGRRREEGRGEVEEEERSGRVVVDTAPLGVDFTNCTPENGGLCCLSYVS